MSTLVAQTDWKQPRGSNPFTVTLSHIPAAGHMLIFVSNGGAISTPSYSGTDFDRTASYGDGDQDSSIWYRTATGAETAIDVSLNGSGDNVGGTILEFSAGLTYTTATTNGHGAAAARESDYQVCPDAASVAGPSLCVATFAVAQASAFSPANRFHNFGPYGEIVTSDAEQDAAGSTKLIYAVGIADVDATASYPVNLAAGHYQATSAYLSGGGTAFATQAFFADTSGVPTVAAAPNAIARENSLPGCDNSNWYLNTAGSMAGIAGFPTAPSVMPGDTVDFKVDSSGESFRVEIYRLGWNGYDNFSARNVLGNQAGYLVGSVATQPTPDVDPVLGSTSCANWTVTASWDVPDNAASGVYYTVFRRTDSGNTTIASTSHFVVRESAVTSKIPIIIPDTTSHAYSRWGATTDHGDGSTGTYTGRSLYQAGTDGGSPNIGHRAYAVSFDRPYSTQATQAMTYIFDNVFPFIVFAEAQGYDLTYLSDIDMENDPTLLNDATMFALVGHHEYWSATMYDCVQNAIAAGVNAFIYSSNTAGWRVRFDPADTDKRVAICYKDGATRDLVAGWSGTGYDPVTPTGTWRDATATNGVANSDRRLEIATSGQRFAASGPVQLPMLIDAAVQDKPLWRNSAGVLALTSGTHLTDISNSIGYEVDSADGSTGQPANLVVVASTSVAVTTGANASGTVYITATTVLATWTLYRDTVAGALVFNAGNWRAWWSATRWQGSSRVSSVSTDIANALLALLYDLGAAPAAPHTMQPGIDTPLIDPAIGAPGPGNDATAIAYGLTAPSGQDGTAALASTPTLTGAAVNVHPVAATLVGTPTLTGNAIPAAVASITLVSTPALAANIDHAAPATTALASTPGLGAPATVGAPASTALASSPALTSTADRSVSGVAALASMPHLTTTVLIPIVTLLPLVSSPALTATAAGIPQSASVILSAVGALGAAANSVMLDPVTLVCEPGLDAAGFVIPAALPYRLRLAPPRWVFALLEHAGEEV